MFSQITASLTLSFTIPSHSKAASILTRSFQFCSKAPRRKEMKSFYGQFPWKCSTFRQKLGFSLKAWLWVPRCLTRGPIQSPLLSALAAAWDHLWLRWSVPQAKAVPQVKKPLHAAYVLPWRQPGSMGTCQSQSTGGWLRGAPQHFILIQELPFSRPYLLTTQICIFLGGICFKQYNPSKHEFPSVTK